VNGRAKVPTAAEVEAARKVIDAARRAEEAAKRAEAMVLVGRYFRYRNSYSSGGKWWMYFAPTGAGYGGSSTGWTFERTSNGEVMINLKASAYLHGGGDGTGYIEITAAEFWRAAASLRSSLVAQLTRPKPRSRRSRASGGRDHG